MDTNYFDYTLEPGKKLNTNIKYKKNEPIISIIMPFYNDKDYIRQAVYSVLNQTFPYFELLIIDDGSKDEESLKMLENIKKLDERIIVFHKENEGLAATRDYGASKSSDSSKYLFILDSDDVIEKTYLECAYWTLETNPKASWAYTDVVGFDGDTYLWNKWFDSNKLKKQNDLVATAMIRKNDFLEVNGYELREKAIHEDWNFWLKMLAKDKFPVRMNFYGFWYRRKNGKSSELKKARDNKKRAIEIINKTAATVKKPIKAIQYPRENYNWDDINDQINNIIMPIQENNNKINLLIIIPWMITGGADKFNLDFISGLDKSKYEITIITTEPQICNYRQNFEKYATVYDLTTFLDRKNWLAFVNYIVKKNNIKLILNTNSRFGYSILPYLKTTYPEIPIIDYIHMEEWYNRNGGYSRDSTAVSSVIDKTLLCNKNSEKILIDHFGRNPEELKTVYIGVDEKEYDPDTITEEMKLKILEKYKINKNGRFTISYICRISEQKRPLLLVQIIKKINELREDVLFVIAGDGNMLNNVKNEIKKYHLTSNVVFTGNITNTKEIYAISDLTINCSIKEGLALTAYESLSMGVPVISSNVGGQKELINKDTGIIVPCIQKEEEIYDFNYKEEEINNYVDAISRILKNINQYKNNCRKRILDGFTIDQMKKDMEKIIQDTINSPNEKQIENGKKLKDNINITKELISLFFEETNNLYSWQCKQYNLNFYNIIDEFKESKKERVKEKLWTIPLWRGFIKIMHKTKIINLIKKK